METLEPITQSKVMSQIANKDSHESFYRLPFNTVRNGKGVIKYTESSIISVEEFEELLPSIISGRCTTLEELYYAYAFRDLDIPITVDDPTFISTLVINYAVSKASFKHRSLFVEKCLLDKAEDYIKDRIERSSEIFELGEIDEEALRRAIDRSLIYAQDEFVNNFGCIEITEYFAKKWHLVWLNRINDSLKADPQRLHIFIGDPGTGKSYQGIKLMGDKRILVVSLSNVVASSIVARAKNHKDFGYMNYTFWSYAKFHYMLSMHTSAALECFDGFILEESSMLSTTELDIILALCETNKPIAVLGDTAQLPGFLGFGNILEGLIKEFPERVTELTENHRAENAGNLVSVFYNVKHNHKLIDTSKMDDVISANIKLSFSNKENESRRLDEMSKNKAIAAWIKDVENGEDSFACAYRKEDVRDLNNLILKNVFNLTSRIAEGNNKYSSKKAVFSEMMMKGISFDAVCTSNLKNSTGYEAFNGERFEVFIVNGRFKCISKLFDHTLSLNINKFAANFDLGYAMTIHKLQGSEASSVLYYEPALSSFINPTNLRYVGLSRARSKLYIAIDPSNRTKFNDYCNVFEEAKLIQENQ